MFGHLLFQARSDFDLFVQPGGHHAPEIERRGTRVPETRRSRYVAIIVLLKFSRQLNLHAIRVGETQEEVVARAVASRTPEDRALLTTQIIGPGQQFRASGNT